MMDSFVFGPWTFCPETRELINDGQKLELKPKNADVLQYLIHHRDRVVSRDELFENLWEDVVVSDHALTKIITELRGSLGDKARESVYIRTLHKKGYRWVYHPTEAFIQEKITTPVIAQQEAPPLIAPTPRSTHATTSVQKPRKSRVNPLIWLIPTAGLILALIYLGSDSSSVGHTQPSSHNKPLALLPFVNETGDKEKEWIELGLRDMVARSLERQSGALELAPIDDLTKALGNTPPDQIDTDVLNNVRSKVDYSWLVRAHVNRQDETYQLQLHFFQKDEVDRHDIQARSLARLTELASFAIANRCGLGSDTKTEAISNNDFAAETYAKGMDLLEKGEIDKAANHFRVSLDNDPGMSWAKFQLARCKRRLGEWEESRTMLGDVLEQSRLLGNPKLEAEALRNLSRIATHSGDWAKAIEATEQARDIYTNLDQTKGTVQIYNQMAAIHIRQGELDKAESHLNESLRQLPGLGNRFLETETLIKLATVLSMHGKLSEAEDYFERALDVTRQIANRTDEAAILLNLGNIANLRRDYANAAEMYGQSLELRRQLKDKLGQARGLYNLGAVASVQGKTKRAHDLFEESLNLSLELGNHYLENMNLNHLGANAYKSGDLDRARQFLEKGMSKARERGNRLLELDAVSYQAFLALRLKQTDKAGALLSSIADGAGEEPIYLVARAFLSYEQREIDEALVWLEKAKASSGERWSIPEQAIYQLFVEAARTGTHQALPNPDYLPMF